VKSQQLLTQRKIFEDEILAGTKGTAKPAEDVPEPHDHAQNLTGTLPLELGAKSLILRVCDVLMNDSSAANLSAFETCNTTSFGGTQL
jgi:hypothetical protein